MSGVLDSISKSAFAMLVSISEGLALEGLLAAILLRAADILKITTATVDVQRNENSLGDEKRKKKTRSNNIDGVPIVRMRVRPSQGKSPGGGRIFTNRINRCSGQRHFLESQWD